MTLARDVASLPAVASADTAETAERYRAAWLDLRRRRIAHLSAFLVTPAFWLWIDMLFHPHSMAVFLPFAVPFLVTGMWAWGFRCPRCGHRWHQEGAIANPLARACSECGLRWGQMR